MRIVLLALVALAVSAAAQAPDQILTAPAAESFSAFGSALDTDGTTVVVGAGGEGADDTGAVYLYRRDGDAWTLDARLVPDDAPAGGRFGDAVAVDDDLAVVGAPEADGGVGAAYVLRRSGAGAWSVEARLDAPESAVPARFGSHVAIDPARVAVGSGRTGAAAVYRSDESGGWDLEAELVPADVAEGGVVALDADLLAVGAWGRDGEAGAVDVYRHEAGIWTYRRTLAAPAPEAGARFGWRLAASLGRLLVGAYGTDDATGSAYLFDADEGALAGTLAAPRPDPGEYFGYDVALDGELALVGAWGDHEAGAHAGRAYLFWEDEATGQWPPIAEYLSEDPVGDNFGHAVALAGAVALVQSQGEAVAGEAFAGAVYAFAVNRPTASEPGPARIAAAVVPNPTAGRAWLDVALAAPGVARVTVVDGVGRRVRSATVAVGAGRQRVPLDLAALPPGVYLWRLDGAGQTARGMVTVAR